jgi:hypothetical protein
MVFKFPNVPGVGWKPPSLALKFRLCHPFWGSHGHPCIAFVAGCSVSPLRRLSLKCDGSLVVGEIVGQQSLVVCGGPGFGPHDYENVSGWSMISVNFWMVDDRTLILLVGYITMTISVMITIRGRW